MRICVYHPTMGAVVALEVARAHPDIELEIASDVTVDPPHAGELDVLLANTLPDGLLARCPRLRWLHLTGTGVDHLVRAEPPSDLLVTNSPDVPARAVAEFVWMGLLALAKDAPRLVARQRERAWRLPNARLVAGSRLVLVGLGHIGSEIARRAPGFDVRVTAVTRRGLPSPLVEDVRPVEELEAAAAQADHFVLAVPATRATRNLVDERVLAALPAHATVVNVSRASVLDTAALMAALESGRLRGALLDVHDEEPLPPTSPLWDVEGLWITPHGAYRFPEEEAEIARLFVENLTAFRAGRVLRNRVELPELEPVP
jgi:phosphoglycerate dehydrogenase-like enzyme